jgi:hypothetical protein
MLMQKLLLTVLSVVFYLIGSAQHIYFAAGGGVNISYYRISKEFVGGGVRGIYGLPYPGGEASLAIGVTPLKTKISPVFEFKATYLYRKFGQKRSGSLGNDSTAYNYTVKAVKESQDIAFSLLFGIRYKQFVFVTGPVIEKFIKSRVTVNQHYEPNLPYSYTYSAGPANDDHQHLRYYWAFRASYGFRMKKNLRITPFAETTIGIKTINRLDAESGGWFQGYVCYSTLGVRIEYAVNLKRKTPAKS